jgi:hypothetical protein
LAHRGERLGQAVFLGPPKRPEGRLGVWVSPIPSTSCRWRDDNRQQFGVAGPTVFHGGTYPVLREPGLTAAKVKLAPAWALGYPGHSAGDDENHAVAKPVDPIGQ